MGDSSHRREIKTAARYNMVKRSSVGEHVVKDDLVLGAAMAFGGKCASGKSNGEERGEQGAGVIHSVGSGCDC